MRAHTRPLPLPLPAKPPPGPFRRDFWRSPLRGPWLASFLSSALLPLIAICAVTGFLSHAAYEPELGRNSVTGAGGPIPFSIYFFEWPTRPAWLYAVTQGLHVGAGLAAIPILLAKLWAVIPQLFEWPPVRSIAHALERLGLALLVGGSLFVFFTGVMNVQLYYPWGFTFVPAHYYAAWVFLAALTAHIATKLGVMRRAFARMGFTRPLRDGLGSTHPEPAAEHSSAPSAPAAPTISRRGLLLTVGAGSLGVGVMAAAQAIGGPVRPLGVLAPRGGRLGSGPNDFPINKTFAGSRIVPEATGESWRLVLAGARDVELSRADLLALPQSTERLPIACVEGWSTTQEWTGVSLPVLARLAGIADPEELLVESLQERGPFRRVTLSPGQARESRALIALKVNGADLSLDHGFPARLIVPAAPGVHNTKWLARMTWMA
jgi:DMSO/TMAO reductase YedYZ molybdopterin-dependent catalytic subunit